MRTAQIVGWGLAAVVVAAELALVEVLWLPLRVGGVLLPVSVLAAVVGNLLLPAAAYRLSGSRVVAAVPAVTWLAVVLAGSTRRPEGDLLVTGSGALGAVNLAFLLLGVVAAAFAVARIVAAPGPSRSSPGRPQDDAGARGTSSLVVSEHGDERPPPARGTTSRPVQRRG